MTVILVILFFIVVILVDLARTRMRSRVQTAGTSKPRTREGAKDRAR